MLAVGVLFHNIFKREKKKSQFFTKGQPCLQNESYKNL